MKALVTGGAGFIGSHLTEALALQGAQVGVLDNLSTGSQANLAWVKPGQKVDLIEGDVRDLPLLQKLVPGCDWVFHLAAIASVPYSIEHPLETHAHNLEATLALLTTARDAGVRRFVFASSCAIYGDGSEPVKTEDLPARPLSPYALQKYASEHYAQLFHRLFGLPTVCLRFFNVFGPRQSWSSPYSGVIARFCSAAWRRQTLTVYGDGEQSRDFVYVQNVVEANLRAVQAEPTRVAGQVFNVGTGQSHSVLDLVATLTHLTGHELPIHHAPARAGEVRSSCADINAARRGLGYRVSVPWEEGLQWTLADYEPTADEAAAQDEGEAGP